MTLESKTETARAALQEVFGDDSVNRSETREALEDLRDEIDTMLDSLRVDSLGTDDARDDDDEGDDR